MNKIEELVKEIAPVKEERPKTYAAEVSHTDEEGVVWVRLPGAEQDTPTASTSTDVKMGDTVTVEWRNNRLYIAGNYTNPSAGVTRVSKVEQTAEKAMSDAGTAQAAAESAQETANAAITIAGDTDQHFWFTETGTDTGAHITEATQEDFLADPTNGGGNLLARSNGIAVRDGLSELAAFSASGASIGRSGELRFFVTPSAITLENDDDEAIFSVVEDAAGKVIRPAVVATYADASEVIATTYTVSDSITASGAASVFFETGGNQYVLGATMATTTVTVGTGVTIALTTAGVDYCKSMMTESGGSGVLSVEYYITHYDKALLDMTGTLDVDGVGDIIGVENTSWTNNRKTGTFITADNTNTGKGVRVGVGTSGQNRGLYDNTKDRWLIYANDSDKTVINGDNFAVSSEGNIGTGGYLTLRTNNRAISFADKNGYIRSMIYINPSDVFGIGFDLFNANRGETRIYGDTLRLYAHNTIQFNSGAELAGNVTVASHSSPIGTKVTGTRESTAGTATTSYTTVAHIDLTAGTWLITGFNSFNGGTAGRRAILIAGTSTATWDAAEGSASGYAAGSMHIALSTSLIVTPTGNATYYLRIKSASQVDSPEGNLTAVRIA